MDQNGFGCRDGIGGSKQLSKGMRHTLDNYSAWHDLVYYSICFWLQGHAHVMAVSFHSLPILADANLVWLPDRAVLLSLCL